MSTEKETPKTSVTYYGKKRYAINPALAHKKPVEDQGELFRFEDESDLTD